MKKIRISIVLLIMIVAAVGCQSKNKDPEPQHTQEAAQLPEASATPAQDETEGPESTEQPAEQPTSQPYITETFESKALAGNIADIDAEQPVTIYLPPTYYESDKNYPVVYFLPGFGESSSIFIRNSYAALNSVFQGGADEFIMVGVSGGGSFFANSPVTGNWEDYVVEEVVSYIDENFRTIKSNESRGICGFSMGGYGAYTIALKHPDVFCSLVTMSPGMLADGDIPLLMESWKNDSSYQTSYARAFSPDTENAPFGNIPELTGTPEDNKIVEDWENGFGNVAMKLDDYISLEKPLKAIKIIYAENDAFTWIARGCEFLTKCLDEKELPYTVDTFSNGHTIHPEAIESFLVPFFNEFLKY